MSLFASAEEGAGWAIVATLVSLILTFLITLKRDRRKAENDAILQWKALTEKAVVERDAALAKVETLWAVNGGLQLRVRELEIELRSLRGEEP